MCNIIKIEPIKGCCHTNLDDYWCDVKLFSRCPNIGERVGVTYKGMPSSLKICQITHDVKNGEVYLNVELHN